MSDSFGIAIAMTVAVSIVVSLGLYLLANLRAHVEVKSTSTDTAPEPAVIASDIAKELGPAVDHQRATAVVAKRLQQELGKQEVVIRQAYETRLTEQNQRLTVMTQKAEQLGKEFKATYEKYQKATAEKTQTESIVRSIAEGLVVVNAAGEVLLMNPAAEKLLGVEKSEGLGKPLGGELKEGQLISMVTEGQQGKEIELKSQSDSTKKILRASTAVIENEQGHTVGMGSVLTGVTKQKEVEELKAKFLSNISHEIRTPIVTIQKALSLIHDPSAGSLTETQNKFVTIAERNLQSLSHLIDDLLDMAKLEAGKMKLHFETKPIEGVAKQVVENLEPWAKSKGVALVLDIPARLPPVPHDPKRISQVLTNLVGNAIKFTPLGGRITVSAAIRELTMEVGVKDTGIGITKEDLPKMFDRFQQVGERVATDISGTGLGLSIAKEIVELHRGKIWVASEVGKGTTFTFSLPLTQPTTIT